MEQRPKHWASEVRPVSLEYLPTEQLTQLVSSLLTADPCVPVGQLEQEVDVENGLTFGEDMNEPGGQQPYRAVLEPRVPVH